MTKNTLKIRSLAWPIIESLILDSGEGYQSLATCLNAGKNFGYVFLEDTAFFKFPWLTCSHEAQQFLINYVPCIEENVRDIKQILLKDMREFKDYAQREQLLRMSLTYPFLTFESLLTQMKPIELLMKKLSNREGMSYFFMIVMLDEAFRHELTIGHRRQLKESSVGHLLFIENQLTNNILIHELEKQNGNINNEAWNELIRYKLFLDKVFEDIGYVLEGEALVLDAVCLSMLISEVLEIEYEKVADAIDKLIEEKIAGLYNLCKKERDLQKIMWYDIGYKYGKRIQKILGSEGLVVATYIALNPEIKFDKQKKNFGFRFSEVFDRFRKIAEIPTACANEIRDTDASDIQKFILNRFGWNEPTEVRLQTLINILSIYGDQALELSEHFPDILPIYSDLPSEISALKKEITKRLTWSYDKLLPWNLVFIGDDLKCGCEYIALSRTNIGKNRRKEFFEISVVSMKSISDDQISQIVDHIRTGAFENFFFTELKHQFLEFRYSLFCPLVNITGCEKCGCQTKEAIREWEKRLNIKLCNYED